MGHGSASWMCGLIALYVGRCLGGCRDSFGRVAVPNPSSSSTRWPRSSADERGHMFQANGHDDCRPAPGRSPRCWLDRKGMPSSRRQASCVYTHIHTPSYTATRLADGKQTWASLSGCRHSHQSVGCCTKGLLFSPWSNYVAWPLISEGANAVEPGTSHASRCFLTCRAQGE